MCVCMCVWLLWLLKLHVRIGARAVAAPLYLSSSVSISVAVTNERVAQLDSLVHMAIHFLYTCAPDWPVCAATWALLLTTTRWSRPS